MSLRTIIDLMTQVGFFCIGMLLRKSDRKLKRTIGAVLQVVSALGIVFFLILWAIHDRA
jgi:hypothetical protein